MPINLSWDDEAETLLYAKFIPPWSWDDFHAAVEDGKKMLIQEEDKRGILIDIRETGMIPPSGFIKKIRQVLGEMPTIPLVIIGDPEVTKILFAPILQLVIKRREFHFVNTLEEAREAIPSSNS